MVVAIEGRRGAAGSYIRIALFVVLIGQVHAPAALAQLPPAAVELDASASLTFDAILKAALEHAPQARSAGNYRELADTHDALGKRLISGRPSWQANYIDDGLLDDVGLMELETGISFNL